MGLSTESFYSRDVSVFRLSFLNHHHHDDSVSFVLYSATTFSCFPTQHFCYVNFLRNAVNEVYKASSESKKRRTSVPQHTYPAYV